MKIEKTADSVTRGYGGVVLVRPGQEGHKPQQWRAWMAYFAWLDDQATPRGRKAATCGSLRQITVPAEWPLEFDLNAPPAPVSYEAPSLISLERRRQLGDMLRAVVGVPPGGLGRRRSDADDLRDGRAKPFSLKLDEGQDAFADRPLHTSVELRGQLNPQPAEVIDDAIDEEITF